MKIGRRNNRGSAIFSWTFFYIEDECIADILANFEGIIHHN